MLCALFTNESDYAEPIGRVKYVGFLRTEGNVLYTGSIFINEQIEGSMSNVLFLRKTQLTGNDQMELLVSKNVDAASVIHLLPRRMKSFVVLAVFAILASLGVAMAVLKAGISVENLKQVGISGAFNSPENALVIMAYPILFVLSVFVAYIGQQIYKEYRLAYNPKNYGRSRKSARIG